MGRLYCYKYNDSEVLPDEEGNCSLCGEHKADEGIEIDHDYECTVCGAPATCNIQNWWHKYSVDTDGGMKEVDDWAGDDNNFYCDKHA